VTKKIEYSVHVTCRFCASFFCEFCALFNWFFSL